jgi:integrase
MACTIEMHRISSALFFAGDTMARKPSVWFREQDEWYYTTFKGQQTKLSRDEHEAERMFHELHAKAPEEQMENGNRPSAGRTADLFLDFSKKNHDPDTFKHYKSLLQRFCDSVGKGRKVADLRPHHVTTWMDKHPHWSGSTRAAAVAAILACLNWAIEQGYIASHPLARLKRGRYERRERIMTQVERDSVFKAIKDPGFRYFLRFLELTGCRPFSEAAAIEAKDVSLPHSTITLQQHKNRRKTGKSRIIYLSPQARELVSALVVLHPEGPIFRNGISGEPWTKQSVQKRFHRLCKNLGLQDVSAYTFRHQYITQALERGVSIEMVAELVGNSPNTIYRHYNHIAQRPGMLAAAARIAEPEAAK